MERKSSRKTFLKGLAITTISLPFAIRACGGKNLAQNNSAPSVLSKKRYRWNMVTTWPPGFPVLQEGCQLLASWVREMSEGRLDIKVFGAGERVPALESFDAVRNGAAEIGSGSAYYWAGKVPAAQFFASVPFGMNAQQMNGWMIGGDGYELWKEVYADYNLVPLIGGNTGVQMGGWFNREINSLADFKGLKMRIPGLGGKVLERAGGTAVLSPGSELYTNLERGIIDATEWIGPYHDYSMGFQDIAKYYYAPGWHEPGTVLEFFVNKKLYDNLEHELQVMLQCAAQRLNGWILAQFESKNALYLDKIIQEKKVEVRNFSPQILSQLRQFTDEIIEDLITTDPLAKRIYSSFSTYRSQAVKWSKLTEKVYYTDLQI